MGVGACCGPLGPAVEVFSVVVGWDVGASFPVAVGVGGQVAEAEGRGGGGQSGSGHGHRGGGGGGEGGGSELTLPPALHLLLSYIN